MVQNPATVLVPLMLATSFTPADAHDFLPAVAQAAQHESRPSDKAVKFDLDELTVHHPGRTQGATAAPPSIIQDEKLPAQYVVSGSVPARRLMHAPP